MHEYIYPCNIGQHRPSYVKFIHCRPTRFACYSLSALSVSTREIGMES